MIARVVREAIDRQAVALEPTGYRVTHVFQVADEELEPYHYVETL